MNGSIDWDSMGWYVKWGIGEQKVESLRNKDRRKAELWLIQGNCHGSRDHHKTCNRCSDFWEHNDTQYKLTDNIVCRWLIDDQRWELSDVSANMIRQFGTMSNNPEDTQ